MSKKEKILTVYEFLTPSYYKEKYSRILLQGKWLRDLGFGVGKKVSVTSENENNIPKLIIKLID